MILCDDMNTLPEKNLEQFINNAINKSKHMIIAVTLMAKNVVEFWEQNNISCECSHPIPLSP